MANSNKIYSTVAVGVVGIVGIALLIKMIRKQRSDKSGDRAATDENVIIAQALNSAISPGRTFLSGLIDSPDKDEIFKIATSIKNFDDISKEYRNLYKENLSLELQDALGNEYNDFIRILQSVKSGTVVVALANPEVLAKKLYDEMDGWNLTRNTKPYSELYRLSDNDFKATIQIFDNKYDEDFATMLKGEYSQSIYETGGKLTGFADIKEKILKRYNIIF